MVLSKIGSLINLHQLVVSFMCEIDLSSTEIVALRGLQNLHTLRIKPQHEAYQGSSTLTDQDFGQLCAGLGGLKHLHFEAGYGLSIEAIILLGKHCRQLRPVKSGDKIFARPRCLGFKRRFSHSCIRLGSTGWPYSRVLLIYHTVALSAHLLTLMIEGHNVQ